MGRDGVGYLYPTSTGSAETGWDIYFPMALDGPAGCDIYPLLAFDPTHVIIHPILAQRVVPHTLGQHQQDISFPFHWIG
jgi:hypothetical protein